MNNLFSYCGLVDAKKRASDKDLPVFLNLFLNADSSTYSKNYLVNPVKSFLGGVGEYYRLEPGGHI